MSYQILEMDDGWSCGAYALANAEAHLKSNRTLGHLMPIIYVCASSDSSPIPLSQPKPLLESDVSWKCGPLASVSEFLPTLLSAMNREGQLMLMRKS